jgi:hypothetical protein
MLAQNSLSTEAVSSPVILLCLSSNSDVQATMLEPSTFGKSLLFHQIYRLSEVGAEKVLIAVDSVPGALLATVDECRSHGLLVEIVRNGSDVLKFCGATCHVLLCKADVIVDTDMLKKVAFSGKNLLIAVEECAENSAFERIDLNNRWTGYGCFDRQALAAIKDFSADWDIGSALLRHGLQQQFSVMTLRQADVAAGQVQHLDKALGVGIFAPNDFHPTGWAESRIFALLPSKLARFIWARSWTREIALWCGPLLCLAALFCAAFNYALASAILAQISILSLQVRQFVHRAEHDRRHMDLFNLGAWICLASALFLVIHAAGMDRFDAVTLAATIVAIACVTVRFSERLLISPLMLAIVFAAAWTGGIFLLAAKLMPLSQILALLVQGKPKKMARLKPN